MLLEKGMEGISIRQMETQFDSAHNTTFITFVNVKVPVKNLIGEEGLGFVYLIMIVNLFRCT